jgi:hypothetical protein
MEATSILLFWCLAPFLVDMTKADVQANCCFQADVDPAAMKALKAVDPNQPIREAVRSTLSQGLLSTERKRHLDAIGFVRDLREYLGEQNFAALLKFKGGRDTVRQLCNIYRNPPRLVAREQLGHRLGLASLMIGTPLPVQLPPLSSSRAKQPG